MDMEATNTQCSVCMCTSREGEKNSAKWIFRAVYRELHAQMPCCWWDFCILGCHESRLSRFPQPVSHRRVCHSSAQCLYSAPSLPSGSELVNHAAFTWWRYYSWQECSFILFHLSAHFSLPPQKRQKFKCSLHIFQEIFLLLFKWGLFPVRGFENESLDWKYF